MPSAFRPAGSCARFPTSWPALPYSSSSAADRRSESEARLFFAAFAPPERRRPGRCSARTGHASCALPVDYDTVDEMTEVIQGHGPALAATPRMHPLAIALIALVAACGQKSETAPAAAGGKAPGSGPPPAEVGVVIVQPRPIGLMTELPGRLEASRVAQVRAR